MEANLHRLAQHFRVLPLLAILVWFAYGDVLTFQFLEWDDGYIYRDALFNPPSWASLWKFWEGPHLQRYIPVTYTAWLALAALSERSAEGLLNPFLFHLANLIFHVINSWLVFELLRTLIVKFVSNGVASRIEWVSLLGATFFAVHPFQVENVAWITSFNDVLSAFFLLSASLLYFRRIHRNSYLTYGLSFVAFILAVLSRPSAVVLPLMLLTADVLILRKRFLKACIPMLPWFAFGLAVAIITKAEIPDSSLSVVVPLWRRIFVASDALSFYLRKLALPFSMGPDYGQSPEVVFRHGRAYFSWIIPCGIALLLWRWHRAATAGTLVLAGYALFVIALLPTLGLIAFDCQHLTTMADRYMYVPLLGVGLAVAGGILNLWTDQGRSAKICLGGALVTFILIARTEDQTRHWRDTAALFGHSYKIDPSQTLSRDNYARSLGKQGKFEEASAIFEQALRSNPDQAKIHNDLGIIRAEQRRLEEAGRHFERAFALAPESAEIRANYENFIRVSQQVRKH